MEETSMKDENATKEPVKVFYNSACPICNAGVGYQKQRMKTCDIEWADVHVDTKSTTELDADLDFIRERLHVKDTEGKLQVGIDAFIALWEESPGERWKAEIIKTPFLHYMADTTYNVFARQLYRWNKFKGHW